MQECEICTLLHMQVSGYLLGSGVGGGKHPELREAGKRDGENPGRDGARVGSQGRWWVLVTLSVLQHLNS